VNGTLIKISRRTRNTVEVVPRELLAALRRCIGEKLQTKKQLLEYKDYVASLWLWES